MSRNNNVNNSTASGLYRPPHRTSAGSRWAPPGLGPHRAGISADPPVVREADPIHAAEMGERRARGRTPSANACLALVSYVRTKATGNVMDIDEFDSAVARFIRFHRLSPEEADMYSWFANSIRDAYIGRMGECHRVRQTYSTGPVCLPGDPTACYGCRRMLESYDNDVDELAGTRLEQDALDAQIDAELGIQMVDGEITMTLPELEDELYELDYDEHGCLVGDPLTALGSDCVSSVSEGSSHDE